jgi:pimeloyl-ACP methyl ester carboxylesterase
MPAADAPPPEVPGVEHRWVDAAGLRVHAAVAGPVDGPPVVLLHGWPQHWYMWRPVLAALAAGGHRAIALDLRGHGWTDAPPSGYDKEQLAADVLAAVDALGHEQFALAGHDWGGWVTQLLATGHPDRVTRVAILNIAPIWGDVRRTLPRAWRFAHVGLNATPVLGRRWQQTPLMEKALLGVPPEDRPVFAARFRDPARAAGGAALYRAFLTQELPALLRGRYDDRRLTQPTLVLHGEDDPVIRPALLETFRAHADDLKIELVPRTGHFVVDERPERVSARLQSWFAAA